MREPIKILDGPMAGGTYQLDRRMFRLYDELWIEGDDGRFLYMIMSNGLKHIGKQGR